MITFKDLEGNSIHVRVDSIFCVITKSPLLGGKDENVILIEGGIKSPVTHAVACDVLAAVEADDLVLEDVQ